MGHPVKPLPFDSHRLCNLKSCCLMSLKKITTKKRKGSQRSAAPVRKKKELYCNNVMINEACTRMDKGESEEGSLFSLNGYVKMIHYILHEDRGWREGGEGGETGKEGDG
ncbi:hypothetical protein MUK42_35126 [Musa troglodytarum]|uniref:Uncharacterized protein n=1 Tax=Musa troglodytarum TaxID=320322 RepID=A0A9E7KYI3_9LILI|nr:hypothetical protein MUK42_35126 [Musa troglodytarum]